MQQIRLRAGALPFRGKLTSICNYACAKQTEDHAVTSACVSTDALV